MKAFVIGIADNDKSLSAAERCMWSGDRVGVHWSVKTRCAADGGRVAARSADRRARHRVVSLSGLVLSRARIRCGK